MDEDRRLTCCKHLESRHLDIGDGRHICLTGFCRCGKPKRKKKKAAPQSYQAKHREGLQKKKQDRVHSFEELQEGPPDMALL